MKEVIKHQSSATNRLSVDRANQSNSSNTTNIGTFTHTDNTI